MVIDRRGLLVLALAAFVFAMAWPHRHHAAVWVAGRKAPGPLALARTWHYQLDHIDVDKLSRIPADVLVIDYAKKEGKIPLTRDDVAQIKAGPDGRSRFVIAYLSVGESEQYRYYWRPEWQSEPPAWLGEENCAWPAAHRVRFWEPGWKDINFAGADSYLKRIIEAGFDGVYLDRVDIYETFEKERKSARSEMIEFVEELAHTAWRLRPGFFIVPQNAEALLSEPRYRSTVDAIGKESLFHGLSATGARNTAAEIGGSRRLIDKLVLDGKPAFLVEYLVDAYQIERSYWEIRAHGYVPTFQTRALDGKDPTVALELKSEVGTPERTKKECPPGTSW